MTKINLLTAGVVSLLVLNLLIVGYLFFQNANRPNDMPPHFPPREPKHVIIESLHFNDEQIKQYESLIHVHRESIGNLKEKISETKAELYQTLLSGDVQKKDSLINVLADLQKEIEMTHYQHFSDIKKICTPDQTKDFEELTKNLANFFEQGRPPRP